MSRVTRHVSHAYTIRVIAILNMLTRAENTRVINTSITIGIYISSSLLNQHHKINRATAPVQKMICLYQQQYSDIETVPVNMESILEDALMKMDPQKRSRHINDP